MPLLLHILLPKQGPPSWERLTGSLQVIVILTSTYNCIRIQRFDFNAESTNELKTDTVAYDVRNSVYAAVPVASELVDRIAFPY